MKPYAILDLAREVAPALDPSTVVVSVAAGVTLDALRRWRRRALHPQHAVQRGPRRAP
ncbi:hypothetical protein QJS66_18860 [Kocuria rhizophila]|nr:hypothetical protein QJS66_18860 [Kocuria rhizophila]